MRDARCAAAAAAAAGPATSAGSRWPAPPAGATAKNSRPARPGNAGPAHRRSAACQDRPSPVRTVRAGACRSASAGPAAGARCGAARRGSAWPRPARGPPRAAGAHPSRRSARAAAATPPSPGIARACPSPPRDRRRACAGRRPPPPTPRARCRAESRWRVMAAPPRPCRRPARAARRYDCRRPGPRRACGAGSGCWPAFAACTAAPDGPARAGCVLRDRSAAGAGRAWRFCDRWDETSVNAWTGLVAAGVSMAG